tara:strand:+ start:411 stop:863 length:453 start_codon:yes stop_codon:yes gene_type:complete
MFPKYHIIINLLISLPLLFIINPFFILIFFLSSFLIDVDHYLYYIVQENSFSLKKAYNWFVIRDSKWRKLSIKERRKHAYSIVIFHGLEIIAILSLLSAFYYPFFFIALGFFVHLVEDAIEEVPLGTIKRKLFLIYSIYVYFTKTKFNHK